MNRSIIRRISLFVIFGLFIILLASCTSKTKIQEAKNSGKVIKITYDANGGTYLNREGITLIDMFNPNDYQADNQGTKHIKLLSPTDPKRPTGGSEGVYITKTNSFLIGWYKNKTAKTNASGNIVNAEGQELELVNNEYYLKNDKTVKSEPLYEYSGHWDFENDTVDYKSDMKEYEMTLYAVWSEYFTFDYYYDNEGSWEKYDSTSFDYMTTNQEGSSTYDKDTIWVPRYVEGTMVYTHKYHNNSTYTFPSLEGKTFKKAYTDSSKTTEITDSFEHQGYIDYETGKSVNPNQKVYVSFENGVTYYISSADQLINNPDLNGNYVIQNDLDFEGKEWPKLFSKGTFNGKISSANGEVVKIKNVKITHNEERTVKYAGIFGQLSNEAVIENINFENATLDLQSIGNRNMNSAFGLFAGKIDDNATLTNVSLTGSILIGNIAPESSTEINLVATGNTEGITVGTIHLTVYGIYSTVQSKYKFTIDPENVIINDSVIVLTLTSTSSSYFDNEKYEIQ